MRRGRKRRLMRNWRKKIFGAVLMAALLSSRAAGQDVKRPDMMGGHPNLNGIWQAINTAYWNLEAHNAEALDTFWAMGAIAAIPAGKSVLKGGGTIPYL